MQRIVKEVIFVDVPEWITRHSAGCMRVERTISDGACAVHSVFGSRTKETFSQPPFFDQLGWVVLRICCVLVFCVFTVVLAPVAGPWLATLAAYGAVYCATRRPPALHTPRCRIATLCSVCAACALTVSPFHGVAAAALLWGRKNV